MDNNNIELNINRTVKNIVTADLSINEKELIIVRLYKKERDIIQGKLIAETKHYKIYLRR